MNSVKNKLQILKLVLQNIGGSLGCIALKGGGGGGGGRT